MIWAGMIRAAAGAAVLAAAGGDARAEGPVAVDAAIVLAIDVSGSMDLEELAVQRAGYLDALRHPDLARIVAAGRTGRIALSHFEWAGQVRADSTVPWRVIDGAAGLEAFAREIEALPVHTSFGTSIARAIDYGVALIEAADFAADRWAIDVSGDGPNNVGPPVTEARDRALAAGVTINGLPIVIRPSRGLADLPGYFEDCVIGGPGAFVMPAVEAEELAPAIRRKLFRELIGAAPEAEVRLAAGEAAPDCLIGERLRRERGQF
ncbi:DUF1194 domain-containing protein [Amaricoccus sp.]|uniref:DUF1194 domain-containing protein n=1 Tax=Amaricoccus sp. TaxID=1872485 RepID=UPI001B48BD81|nr:DUF1194 domain-containing protein [Amaricoccus sp.]MBP7002784.1 DUF1194 domain-containing protein [Amaricoccus sp.]